MAGRFRSSYDPIDEDAQDIGTEPFHSLSARSSLDELALGARITSIRAGPDDLDRWNAEGYREQDFEVEHERTSYDVERLLEKSGVTATPSKSKGRRFWLVVVGIMLCDFLRGFDDTIVSEYQWPLQCCSQISDCEQMPSVLCLSQNSML